jgi:glycosyltransferase involved in cell wall biosynthesis
MSTAAAVLPRPRIWLITDQAPAPVRNGITLPLFNYVQGLRELADVGLCLLEAEGAADQNPFVAESSRLFGTVLRFKLQRKGRGARLLGELAGREMFQHGWFAATAPDTQVLSQMLAAPCLVSPMSAVAKWRALRAAADLAHANTVVAAVNDCTAAEYRFRHRATGGTTTARIKARIDGLRAPLIGRIESALLTEYDNVLLQTQADRAAMHDLSSAAVAAKVVLAPNGVSTQVLGVEPQPELRVLFVAELSGEHGATADWLVRQVWPKVIAALPAARLHIVGRGASPGLAAALNTTAGVEHQTYVDDLAAVYQRVQVVLSPVFKGFGLINKTLEGMAAGTVVLGPAAAFNGIAGFVPGVHGLLVSTPAADEFAKVLLSALSQPALCSAIGGAARTLVREQFNWGRCIATLDRLLLDRTRDQAPDLDRTAPALRSLPRMP